MLLERGAEPYDIQVVYNIHFHGKILWYMELMYEFSVKAGRKTDWDDPEWRMLDMGGYGSGARWRLWIAVQRNDLELAEWRLSHGANPDAAPPRDRRFSQRGLYEESMRRNHTRMAELLASHGAHRTPAVLEGEDGFVTACFRRDHDLARTLLKQHPEYLRSPAAMHTAAIGDHADVARFLLDLRVSPDIEDPKQGGQRPLHAAAYHGSSRVAALLIERGAKIDPVDSIATARMRVFAVRRTA